MEPIKEVGTHPVKIHVHGDHFAEVKVVVEAETTS
jgi:ribosomal protein L9